MTIAVDLGRKATKPTNNQLTEHHLEFLSLKGGFIGSSESTLVKMSNCWKSQAVAQIHMK